MMRREKNSNIFKGIAIAILSMAAIWGAYWIMIASYYCAPNAEDYSLANYAMHAGLWRSVTDTLMVNYTRYTALFFYAFNVLTLDRPEHFVIMPVSCLLFFIGSFYFFISSVLDSKGMKLILMLFSLLFVFVHYALEPSLPYGLTYMVSTFVYFYPWFFAFLWMGCLLRALRETNNVKRVLLMFAGYLFLIFSYGSSELFFSINAIFLSSFLLFSLKHDRSKLNYIIPFAMLAITCMTFIDLCPSPKVTSANILENMSARFPHSNFVLESFKSYIWYYFHYLCQPLSLSFVLVTTLLIERFDITKKIAFRVNTSHLIFLFLFFTVGSYLSTWIFIIPKGTNGDFSKYIYNSIGLLAQIALYIIAPLYLNLNLNFIRTSRFSTYFDPAAALLFTCLLICSNNNIRVINQEYNKGYLQDIKIKADKLYRDVELAKKSGAAHTVVYYENPRVIPSSIYLENDILPNRASACWNIAYEDYFGVNEVRLAGDTVFK